MFNLKSNPQDAALDEAISDIFNTLKNLDKESEEYSAVTDQLLKLMKLKKEITPSWRPSPDAVVGALGSILGIILILRFEQFGVITTKALGLVNKMR